MFFRKRDWPWGLIGLVFALLGVLLYSLYQMGPHIDAALLAVGACFAVARQRDTITIPCQFSSLFGLLYAAAMALLLWWGGFWSPSIPVCADLCQASEVGR